MSNSEKAFSQVAVCRRQGGGGGGGGGGRERLRREEVERNGAKGETD